MSTSANKKSLKTALVYLCIAIFTAFAGAVYECFSHGVYSFHMIYAFAYPLVGGALPYLVLCLKDKEATKGAASQLYHCGIATLTLGSIVKGVLEIYGTTNELSCVYTPVGVALLVIGVMLGIVKRK